MKHNKQLLTESNQDYKVYQRFLEIKKKIDSEKEEREKEIVLKELTDFLKNKQVIVENALPQ